jgi:ATP adenylyltransferase
MKYVTGTNKSKIDGCVFCAMLRESRESDPENHIVYRGKSTFVVMNIYPYNTGHLMILPYEHVASLSAISPTTHLEIMTLISYFIDLLTELMHPDGFNVGLNLGRVAGAGIDSHLHMHLVPRWGGDSNFMAVIAETRVLPETLDDTYRRIVAMVAQTPPALGQIVR